MARLTGFFLLVIAITAFVATFNVINMFSEKDRYYDEAVVDDGDTRESIDMASKNTEISTSRKALGVIKRPESAIPKVEKKKRMFHTAVTANDNPYSKWQCRVMYFWYKKYAAMEGSEMGGYTRILHTGEPDNLMDEIPTWVAQPLPPGMDQVGQSRYPFVFLPEISPYSFPVSVCFRELLNFVLFLGLCGFESTFSFRPMGSASGD